MDEIEQEEELIAQLDKRLMELVEIEQPQEEIKKDQSFEFLPKHSQINPPVNPQFGNNQQVVSFNSYYQQNN